MGTAQEKTKTLAEIIASFNADRVQGLRELFAEEGQRKQKTIAILNSKGENQGNCACTVDTTQRLAEYESRIDDEHWKARQGFKVIVPERRTTHMEYRQRLGIIRGGGKKVAGVRALKRRQGFKVYLNHRTDQQIADVNWLYEVGMLR